MKPHTTHLIMSFVVPIGHMRYGDLMELIDNVYESIPHSERSILGAAWVRVFHILEEEYEMDHEDYIMVQEIVKTRLILKLA